jgi:hypothetical protein
MLCRLQAVGEEDEETDDEDGKEEGEGEEEGEEEARWTSRSIHSTRCMSKYVTSRFRFMYFAWGLFQNQ